MSKSLGNIISPYEVIDKYGADTLRYYMIGGANAGVDINYNFDDVKAKYRNLTVLWNLHNFLIDCARTIKANPKEVSAQLSLEEEFIFSKLNTTIKRVTELFEQYRIDEVPWAIEELFLELSRTYLQLTREKSSVGSKVERETVLYTIYNVLLETSKLFAPIAPLITEKIYQNLKKEFGLQEESIHLLDWPSYNKNQINERLEKSFENIKQIIQAVLSGREKLGLGVRWPLKEVVIVSKNKEMIDSVKSLVDIVKTHTNVKDVSIQENLTVVKQVIKADYKKLGQDFREDAPKIIAKLTEVSAEEAIDKIDKEGKLELKIDGKKVEIVKEHLIIQRVVPLTYVEEEFRNGFIYLNKERTDELEAEGYARETVRRIQALRKEHGFVKTD
ncbi:MAG TPA: class I tRNA ligase family protein, partial [archaeon]|nr:class I tRNA ligase family protein [archaeon]